MPAVNTESLQPEQPSLASRAGILVRDLRDLACDHLELAALEAQRAGLGLTRMVSAAVVVSILLVTAWLALVSGGIVWATTAGVSWPAALVAAASTNLVLAALLALWIRSAASERIFDATLRQMRKTADDVMEEAS